MTITTAEYKAAIEAKIAAATGATSLKDLTLIKTNADLWLLNNDGGSITGYASLEALIQDKQDGLTGSSTLNDVSFVGVSAFPPEPPQQAQSSVYSPDEFFFGSIPSGSSGTLLTITPELDECVCLHVLYAVSANQGNTQVEFGTRTLIAASQLTHIGDTSTVSNRFSIGNAGNSSVLASIVGRVGEALMIKRTSGSTSQNINYCYSIGRLI